MLKIGDFSHLSHVSVRMLRHYDELGLLKPVQVDRFTGYRYYSIEQLPRLNRILALKDLGFSLDQITQLLAADDVSEATTTRDRRKLTHDSVLRAEVSRCCVIARVTDSMTMLT